MNHYFTRLLLSLFLSFGVALSAFAQGAIISGEVPPIGELHHSAVRSKLKGPVFVASEMSG
jgi:hypothetical protein